MTNYLQSAAGPWFYRAKPWWASQDETLSLFFSHYRASNYLVFLQSLTHVLYRYVLFFFLTMSQYLCSPIIKMHSEDRALHAYNVPLVFIRLDQLINRLIHLWACTIRFSDNMALIWQHQNNSVTDKQRFMRQNDNIHFSSKTHPFFPPPLFILLVV